MPSRVLGSALAAAALGLFAATFAPWFDHQQLNDPGGEDLRDSESLILALSGWELEGTIAALVLLAVFLGTGAGIWSIRRPGDPFLIVACALAVLASLAAAWVIGAEMRSPSDSIYNDARVWIGVALAAALATTLIALLTGLASLRQRDGSRTNRAVWPVIGGAAVLYLLALGVNALELWQPQLLAACCAAAVIGYLASRWWVAILPIAAVFLIMSLAPDPDSELRDVVYGFIALVVSAALLIGIGTRVLRRRVLRQQQV